MLLLLIAQQKPKKAAKAIRAVIDANSDYEQWLHRNLLFAGTCLAENVTVDDERLVEDILRRLVELEVSKSPLVPSVIRNRIFKILCSFGETQYEAQALQQLEAVAESVGKIRLNRYRTALEKPEAATQELLSQLTDEDTAVRSQAVEVLGQLGNASRGGDQCPALPAHRWR